VSEPQTLEQKLETREIPRFDIPRVRTVEDFFGHTVEIYRANTEGGLIAFHRLSALFGPTLLKLFSWDDDSAPRKEVLPTGLSEILKLDFDNLNDAKAYMLIRALPALKDNLAKLSVRDLMFLVDHLIIGHMRVSGVLIKTRKELDETGISLAALGRLMFEAITVNCFPTFAARSTKDGSDEAAPESDPTVSPKSQRKRSNGAGGTRRAGRSVRTRKN